MEILRQRDMKDIHAAAVQVKRSADIALEGEIADFLMDKRRDRPARKKLAEKLKLDGYKF